MILGIDEAGRGPWAGPLVVGAVVLPDGAVIEGLTDSKKLTKRRREALEPIIQSAALSYGLGWVHADELDEVGMSEALRRATVRAVSAITAPYQKIVIDGTVNFLAHTGKGAYVTTLPKADAIVPSVSAASILAKVARDRFMTNQAHFYPAYGFDKHAGYGTAYHREAIAQSGVTPLHRLSFAPLVAYAVEERPIRASTGGLAEDVAELHLKTQGFDILERNWRTRYCEIDIIASKEQRLYIIEVKHRRSAAQGGGIATITPRKLQKMSLGALSYSARHQFEADIHFVVITTTGVEPRFESFLEIE